MTDPIPNDAWQAGDRYEGYMGRWSRRLAPGFVRFLDPVDGLDWLDIGCGTGALSASVLALCNPKSLIGIDPTDAFVATARANLADSRAQFRVGDAHALDLPDASRDMAGSALVLNFLPDRPKALSEMRRVTRPRGTIGLYVWDYPGGGLQLLQAFWEAAADVDARARALSEDRRFPFCTPTGLIELARDCGLVDVECAPIEIATEFKDFDDFWRPFTHGTGPAPGFCTSLDPTAQLKLADLLRSRLPYQPDGTIALTARAWAVKARNA